MPRSHPRRRVRPRHLCLVFAVLASACSDDGGDADLVDRRLVLVSELRIGSIDDQATALTSIRALEVGVDGRMYTLHPQEGLIRVHDVDGAPLASIGRKGEGPGEFEDPAAMGWRGDSLWVHDTGSYRFSYFSPDGRFLIGRAVTVDRSISPGTGQPRPTGLLADGTIFGHPLVLGPETEGTQETVLLRLDERSHVRDTLARYTEAHMAWRVQDPRNACGFYASRAQPFSDSDIVTPSRTELEVVRVERTAAAIAEGAQFRVSRISFSGDTLLSRAYRYNPISIDGMLVDSLVRDFSALMTRMALPGATSPARTTELVREALYAPEFHPPVTALLLGRDGSIWLRRESVLPDTIDWLVLSRDGDIVGTVSTSRRLTILAAETGRIWGMEMDDLDVPYLVRYAVREEEAS